MPPPHLLLLPEDFIAEFGLSLAILRQTGSKNPEVVINTAPPDLLIKLFQLSSNIIPGYLCSIRKDRIPIAKMMRDF
jgi:hypothetical protein